MTDSKTTVRWIPSLSILSFHRSTKETFKVWAVERRTGFGFVNQFLVRCYEHNVMISEEQCTTEIVARKIFERKVEAHYHA